MQLKIKGIYITAILLARVIPSWPQDSVTYKPDTIIVLKGSVITVGNEKYIATKDTTFIIPSGTDYKLRPNRKSQSDNFFDSLELHASQRKWMNKLHNIVITAPRKESISDTIQTSQSILPYIEYGGKIIRNIKIQRLDPFGPTILDTTRIAISKLETAGNKLHSITREKVISKYLIFSEGDRLDPSIISDNERIIRKLPFIEDARILITQIPENPDYVDILVLAKDAFSIGAGGEVSDWDAGSVRLFDNNLGGTGHELHANFYWDGSKDPWFGKEIYYLIHNLGGSFIDNRITYSKVFNKEFINIRFDRPFFTPSVKYAGGVQYEHTSKISKIDLIDSVISTRINYNLTDLWAGRSFALTSVRKYSVDRINFVIASRIQKSHFFKRPEVTDNTFYEFHNKTLWLSSVSITSQIFFRSNLIYSFGRTEDIPHGYLLNFTFGPEFGEFNRRFYMGMSFSWGGLVRNLGYIYTRGELGGFSNPIKSPDQGIIHFQYNYFSNLFIFNRFKLRQFLNVDYIKGIQRFSDEFISLENNSGIRGYNNEQARGIQRATVNLECVAFSPYYFYGFRFVFFGFADFGLISFSQPIFETKLHSGIGLGIRIKNERLTFETIQLRLAYYPSMPGFMSPFGFELSGEKKLNPQDFYAEKPVIIGFN
jgi:hypothetical protein